MPRIAAKTIFVLLILGTIFYGVILFRLPLIRTDLLWWLPAFLVFREVAERYLGTLFGGDDDAGGLLLKEVGPLLGDAIIFWPFAMVLDNMILLPFFLTLSLVADASSFAVVMVGREKAKGGIINRQTRSLLFAVISLLVVNEMYPPGFVYIPIWLGLILLTLFNIVWRLYRAAKLSKA